MIASDAIYSMSRVAGSHSVVNGESTGCKENLLWICQLELNSGLKQQSLWIGFLVYLQMQMGKFKGFLQVCKWQLSRVLQIMIHWLKNTEQTYTVFARNKNAQITEWLYKNWSYFLKVVLMSRRATRGPIRISMQSMWLALPFRRSVHRQDFVEEMNR